MVQAKANRRHADLSQSNGSGSQKRLPDPLNPISRNAGATKSRNNRRRPSCGVAPASVITPPDAPSRRRRVQSFTPRSRDQRRRPRPSGVETDCQEVGFVGSPGSLKGVCRG
jgi:hypothetical protein